MRPLKTRGLVSLVGLILFTFCNFSPSKDDPDYRTSPPPTPDGLRTSYDTANGCVTLRWNHVTVPDLAGYVVYRNNSTSGLPVQLNTNPALDTFYRDCLHFNSDERTNSTYSYRVKSVDDNANLSIVYSDVITLNTPSPDFVRTRFVFNFLGLTGDSSGINDTVGIVVNYTNTTRKNVSLSWFDDSQNKVVRQKTISAFNGLDTFYGCWKNASLQQLHILVRDEAGSTWSDSTSVWIVRGEPIADAGKDTTVIASEKALLRGKAYDNFGVITKYEWDIGNTGDFVQTSSPDTTITTPPEEQPNFICIFRVTDDDSNFSTDTVAITVKAVMPVVKTANDTTVAVSERIALRGEAHDSIGVITKYEWDIGNTGQFIQTSSPDTIITAPSTQQIGFQCIFRATNNYSNTSKDTMNIDVYNGILIDIDGNKYHTVKIGNQEWTVENLHVTRFNDSTIIPFLNAYAAWTCSTAPAYSFCFLSNENEERMKEGLIYNWFAASSATLAPRGWRVPHDSDWVNLQDFLSLKGYPIAKSLSAKTGWYKSTFAGTPGNNPESNNRCGFSAKPVICINYDGRVTYENKLQRFWASSSDSAGVGSCLKFEADAHVLTKEYLSSCCGMAVRLVRTVE